MGIMKKKSSEEALETKEKESKNTENTELQNTEKKENTEAQEVVDPTGGDGPMVLADNLVKIYKTTELEVMALQGLDLTVNRGELLAIIGNSGSGKSTFLNMLGGLDTPSAGRLFVDGNNLFTMNEKQLVSYKRDTVGFVWQNNGRNLLPYLTAIENVMTPMHFSVEKDKKEKARQLLELVGMEHKRNNRLNQLSGGEQQRIAIAIALANSPKLLLADEPTGSVDRRTADYILDVFRHLNQDLGQTIIIVTHDVELSKRVPRVVNIQDGKISSERIMRGASGIAGLNSSGEDTDNTAGGENSSAGQTLSDWDEPVQEEYSVIDRVGRVQIPKKMLEDAGITNNRVVMELRGQEIILRKMNE